MSRSQGLRATPRWSHAMLADQRFCVHLTPPARSRAPPANVDDIAAAGGRAIAALMWPVGEPSVRWQCRFAGDLHRHDICIVPIFKGVDRGGCQRTVGTSAPHGQSCVVSVHWMVCKMYKAKGMARRAINNSAGLRPIRSHHFWEQQ
jgi:hypothetical protein